MKQNLTLTSAVIFFAGIILVSACDRQSRQAPETDLLNTELNKDVSKSSGDEASTDFTPSCTASEVNLEPRKVAKQLSKIFGSSCPAVSVDQLSQQLPSMQSFKEQVWQQLRSSEVLPGNSQACSGFQIEGRVCHQSWDVYFSCACGPKWQENTPVFEFQCELRNSGRTSCRPSP